MKNIFYLTNEGFKKIKKEKELLEKKKNKKLKLDFPIFNRSKRTDPDYVNCLEEISFMKRRIMEIKNILRHARIIAPSQNNCKVINVGAKVTIKDELGGEMAFQIVETIETNPSQGKISSKSPMGSALIGHRAKESVFVKKPVNKRFLIKKIEY